MPTATVPSRRVHVASYDRLHPLCRGDFAAVVFSGRIDDLGEWPGEPTAHAVYKFALIDPRLDNTEDFARSPNMPLPTWPAENVRPTDGVCFVFADDGHPGLLKLIDAGAIGDQHYIVLDRDHSNGTETTLRTRLTQLVRATGSGSIALLGYGHQGQAIAAILGVELDLDRSRLVVFDGNRECLGRAAADGLVTTNDVEHVLASKGVIYTPLMRHDALHRILEAARARGATVLDNSQASSGLKQFVQRAAILLDAPSDGALRTRGRRISPGNHGLALTCHLIREDRRRIGATTFPHLHGGHRFSLLVQKDAIDCGSCSPFDALASDSFEEATHTFVSVRDRADHGFFAARHLCERIWPRATREVFPSEHVVDLGATSFERLLQGHLAGREIASTMQTPAQRATLGIMAAHYANNRPIIEIGSGFGGSALLMAAATDVHRPPIVSIDPETSTRDIMRFAFEREGHLDRLQQVVKTSVDAVGELRHLLGKAGLVFIDGLHSASGVLRDYENYAPMVAHGGALLFHDVCPQIYSVLRLIVEHAMTDRRFEIKCLVDGLAVFERRA